MQWTDAFRASRIAEVLGSGRMFSVAEMTRLQNDDLSIVARALTPLLRDVSLANPASAPRARSADAVGLRARQGFGRGRHLRDVAAAPARQHARGGGARRRSRKAVGVNIVSTKR